MSTIKVNKIENTSTTDGGISIDSSGHVTVDGQQMPSAGPLSNRNLVQNGAMRIAQRQISSTGNTTASYLCDRWLFAPAALGTWTLEQSTDAPTGFSNSFKATCTTADASPATGDYVVIVHRMEAQNLQHLKYGTSEAESLVISFYVKSNKTGSASFGVQQNDNGNNQFTKAYTINSPNVWEHKKITIPGDTAGVIDNDNGIGLIIDFWLNSGSTYTGGTHNAAWEVATQPNRNADNLGVGGAVDDYFAITGVQLELGSNDKFTPFEHRSFGDDLAICQRYFCKSSSQGVFATAGANHATTGMFDAGTLNAHATNSGYTPTIYYPVSLRDEPSTVITVPTHLAGGTLTNGQVSVYDGNQNQWENATASVNSSTTNGFNLTLSGSWQEAFGHLTFFAWTAEAEL
tara:strand:+ start:541 stop:1749 length:1209 start_codon:yes stop_codon:yes gene_type:complete